MTHLRKITGEKDAQLGHLRRFFRENHVSLQLAKRIWRNAENTKAARQHRIAWRDVKLLRDLPELLQMELEHEVYMPILSRHPFFHQVQENHAVAMRALCHSALREHEYRTEQEVFHGGLAVDKVYFVKEGVLVYRAYSHGDFAGHRMGSRSTLGSCAAVDEVSAGSWLSEAALWVKWFHVGKAAAKTNSVLTVLSVPALFSVLQEYAALLPGCCAFAGLFIQALQELGDAISDLPLGEERLAGLAEAAFADYAL